MVWLIKNKIASTVWMICCFLKIIFIIPPLQHIISWQLLSFDWQITFKLCRNWYLWLWISIGVNNRTKILHFCESDFEMLWKITGFTKTSVRRFEAVSVHLVTVHGTWLGLSLMSVTKTIQVRLQGNGTRTNAWLERTKSITKTDQLKTWTWT